jgi:hypothetical protein
MGAGLGSRSEEAAWSAASPVGTRSRETGLRETGLVGAVHAAQTAHASRPVTHVILWARSNDTASSCMRHAARVNGECEVTLG